MTGRLRYIHPSERPSKILILFQISTRMEKILNFLRVFSFILYLGRIHAASHHGDHNMQKLKTIYSWKSLDFEYPNAAARQKAINSGEFNEGGIIPLDVDVVYGHSTPKVLITIPRFQKGVPVTLGVVTNKLSAKGDPIIKPYPNWEWNRPDNCDHFTDIYRVSVDDCNRIWVLDTGKLYKKQICPAQLLVFDASTDRLLSRYKFPMHQSNEASSFIEPIIDIISRQNQCLDTFVYIIDVSGYQLLVYDHKQKKSWNIQHNAFNGNPVYGSITINDLSFPVKDGIFSGALGPPQTNGDRILYFHPLRSVAESWVSTSVIRNSTTFIKNTNPPSGSIHTFKLTRTSQSSVEAMSKDGILFYGMVQQTSLGCWNSVTHPNFGGNNLETLVTSSSAIEFTSGMKIRQHKEEPEKLWMMTVPFAQYRNKVLNPNVTNFRILSNSVHLLIQGTKCDRLSSRKNNTKPCKKGCKNPKHHP